MQLPIEQKDVGELMFTSHLSEADPTVRAAKFSAQPKRNIETRELSPFNPLYETVINKDNILNPEGRLRGAKYYIPAKENTENSFYARDLPTANEGFFYRGGTKGALQMSKNLGQLNRTNGMFYSGEPQISVNYLKGQNDPHGTNPLTTPLIPAGYTELRKYLSPARSKINQAAKNIHDYVAPKTAAADQPLKSSNIKAVGYDKKNRTLEVAFHSGEDHSSLFEKVSCLIKEAKGRCWEGYEPVPGKLESS
jgi:hypothetical protein